MAEKTWTTPGCSPRWARISLMLFLAEIPLLANELDLDTVFGGQSLDGLPDLVTHRRGPLFEVEDPDPPGVEKHGHRVRVADVGQGPLDDYAVGTGKHAHDLVRMTFAKVSHMEQPPHKGNVPRIWSTYSSNLQPCMVPACPG